MTDPTEGPRSAEQKDTAALEQAVVEANLALREELEARTRALDATESRFRAILGATQDGIVVVDRDGSVLFANAAAAELLQMKTSELTGEPFGLPLGGAEPVLVELLGKEGSMRSVEMQVVETEWEGTTAHLATLHDVTALKQGEALLKQVVRRLEEVNELKNEFVGMVVHDMRTPLTIISGFAQTLRQNWGAFDADQTKEILERIESKSAELTRMVGDTLQVSAIESNAFGYRIATFDIGEVIERTVEAVREVAFTDARIDVAIPDGLPLAFADKERQSQVLTNLISNAIKYSEAPAEVTITAHEAGGDLQISVADRGRGIPEREMNKLFKKFSRLRQTANVQGSGLGLYICKRMIEDQGGRIWVESEFGVGSTFHYTVPLAVDRRNTGGYAHRDERD